MPYQVNFSNDNDTNNNYSTLDFSVLLSFPTLPTAPTSNISKSNEQKKIKMFSHSTLPRFPHPDIPSGTFTHIAACGCKGGEMQSKRPTCNSSLCGTTDTEHIIIMEEKGWLSNTGNVVYFCLSYRRTKREEEEKKEKGWRGRGFL